MTIHTKFLLIHGLYVNFPVGDAHYTKCMVCFVMHGMPIFDNEYLIPMDSWSR